jgi:pimeloyl-ACP methyl ester carboxylesterase
LEELGGEGVSVNVVALHGFMGRPSFWEESFLALEADEDFSCWAPDLYRDEEFEERSWLTWPDQFETWLERQGVSGPILLMGYSMGGRLALEFARRRPHWLSHLVLISARGGRPSPEEFTARQAWEEKWLARFRQEKPEAWMKEWNAQEVFRGTAAPELNPREISVEALADSFSGWSLTQQIGDWEDLGGLPTPTLWLFGQNDQKYLALAEKTKMAQPQAEIRIVAEAGHRIPLDQPGLLVEHIRSFLEKG